jgi:enoyl-CoA hydratase
VSDQVSYRREGSTAIIAIERPERRNAVDSATADLLVDAFERFDQDNACSVAIFASSNGAFCAGADLRAISEGSTTEISETGRAPMGPSRMRLSKPVIAAIEGHAVAGGLELALWCDLRVVAEDAVMGVFCRRFGVPLVDLGSIKLPRLIGHSRAMDLILTGRAVDAEEALQIGLANRVAAKGETLAAALKLAEEIAAFPQGAMRGDRQSAIDQWSLTEDDAITNEICIGKAVIDSGETKSGATRFSDGDGRHGQFSNTDKTP